MDEYEAYQYPLFGDEELWFLKPHADRQTPTKHVDWPRERPKAAVEMPATTRWYD